MSPPVYEYECQDCGNEWEDVKPYEERLKSRCPRCGLRGQKLPTVSQVARFKPFDHWNLDAEGSVRIESRGQLREECKKRGVKSRWM